jgi:hypothetical protein
MTNRPKEAVLDPFYMGRLLLTKFPYYFSGMGWTDGQGTEVRDEVVRATVALQLKQTIDRDQLTANDGRAHRVTGQLVDSVTLALAALMVRTNG